MSKIAPEQLAREWEAMMQAHPDVVRQHVRRVAQAHQDELATHFYEHMLAEPVAAQFLSHEQVRSRLHASMQRWLVGVFEADQASSLLPVIAQQVQIGEVHARIDVPMHLVLRGARQLKHRMNERLREDAELAPELRAQAAQLSSQVIDAAMEIMSQAYATSHDRHSRAAEAYRLFAVSQNVGAERERQRGALLAWENQLMFEQALGTEVHQWPRLGSAEFGLWFRHKGAHAFAGTAEAQQILEAMDHIDDVLLPMFQLSTHRSREETVNLLREFRDQTRTIGFLLDTLFEQNNELESGRDVLTRLLNRKFLPVVLSKEVQFARQRKSAFALLAIDIDHFKRINDTHGHEAGDTVLQQLAAILTNTSRGGDYIFRLGGEEFMMVLVDTHTKGAASVAEKLRRAVETEVFRLPLDRTLQLTISVGVAAHSGHPDYLRTMRLADDALYQAKHAGRNRVVVLES